MISRKLELGLRRNQGRKVLPQFLEAVSSQLSRPKESIKLLDIEPTEELWQTFLTEVQARRSGAKPAFQMRWKEEEIDKVRLVLDHLSQKLPGQHLLLFRSQSKFCGAIEVSSREIFDRAFDLVELDGENLMSANHDVTYGVVFEYFSSYDEEGDYNIYQLLVWGDTWMEILYNVEKMP